MGKDFPIEKYININISDDKLSAYLQFNLVDEEFSCSIAKLEEFVKSHGIINGVHYDKLSAVVKEPKSFFYDKTVIATGDQPVDGEAGYIKNTYELDQKLKTPAEKEDGTVDYKQVGRLNNVRKGQLIAEKVLAKEGIPGRAVTGEVVFAKKGKEANFKIGKNVVTDAEKTKLYAAIDGLVTKTDRDKINVFPIYEVNGDVDYHIGNIEFVGTVVIRGNVLNGFSVKAVGDIRVIGGVEGADLEAEGSIEITAGILGHNKGSIKAGKNVKSSFIQDANVEAKEDILVTQSIMHSHIRAGRNVICQGTKGLIVGGIIQAGEQVTARTIGNTMSTNTVIEVGVLPHLRNELIELRAKIKNDIENMSNTDKALTLLDQLASTGNLSPDKMALRVKLNNTKKQSLEEIQEMKERILEIEKSLENTTNARVDVTAIIYGGSKIVIGRYTKYIKDTVQRSSFRIAEGDVVMTSKF
jgi:uncharacterized protein (DUF342 family)